jgi:hypothetical protein
LPTFREIAEHLASIAILYACSGKPDAREKLIEQIVLAFQAYKPPPPPPKHCAKCAKLLPPPVR